MFRAEECVGGRGRAHLRLPTSLPPSRQYPDSQSGCRPCTIGISDGRPRDGGQQGTWAELRRARLVGRLGSVWTSVGLDVRDDCWCDVCQLPCRRPACSDHRAPTRPARCWGQRRSDTPRERGRHAAGPRPPPQRNIMDYTLTYQNADMYTVAVETVL